jgi:phospholipid/cholesterol/gamma-HCH transport system substrate-binding protein
MLSRFVRIQLLVFTVLSIFGLVAFVFVYMQAPTLFGLGRMNITVELPNTGGLYRFANVTYRGVQVGKVTGVDLASGAPTHTEVSLSLDSSARIPADLVAEVHSISAVGEQYVDLVPRTDSGPYLRDGSVIAMRDTTVPQQVGPVLDQTSALLASIPKDRLNALVDESSRGFNGAGYDLGSLIDSSATLSHDINGVADRGQQLIEDSAPLLDGQNATTDSIRAWSRSLAGITGQLAADDPKIRTVLQRTPGALDEVSRLLADIKPTLPVLLTNLTTIGKIGVTYNASAQQVLILLPAFVSTIQAALPRNNATGIPTGGEFAITAGDPNPCTVGFLPPSQWRNPADTTEIDTPDGLYCKLPQDSPSTVRGARNYPCMAYPGKRAATVQECDDPRGFQPIAVRNHVLGPDPIDPNLIAQGIPPDDRATSGNQLYAPPQGTPLPNTAPPADAPPPPEPEPSAPTAAPRAFHPDEVGHSKVAVAQYNPRTGSYLADDGHLYTQTDLVTPVVDRNWTELLPH